MINIKYYKINHIGILGLIEGNCNLWTINRRQMSSMTDNKKSKNGWHDIDWKKTETKVRDIQEKIVIATIEKDFKKVYNLQWKLLTTFEAKALAIRKVITNKGGKTSGTDKITWENPNEYYRAIKELEEIINNINLYKAKPLLRVLIPKGNTGEMRPLGIPTMIDRAVQAIYHLGVDPVVEAQSDPNSYGFRKNRSTHDAITAIRSILDKETHPRWILEADISKCFDKISHDFLLKHTPICHKQVLKQWLSSGVMENMKFTETTDGTPQGGIISPTLCNIALNGIEELIKKANPLKKGISAGVHIIRYADDMIITGRTQEVILKNKLILTEFLSKRGLQLNEKKTLVTNIKDGFNFLGFNIRRMPHNTGLNQDTDQKTVLIIKPSKKGIRKLKDTICTKITMNKPIEKIISELNPVLRGWGEHKRISYHSQETFISIDHWIYGKMLKWVSRKKGSLRKNINKYITPTVTRAWNWTATEKIKLINLGEISIIRLRPLKLDRNPYVLANTEYFNKRREKLIDAKFRATIYKDYKQICPICETSLHNGEQVELHHIIPQVSKGKYSRENIIPLHQICHQQVTHGNKSLERFKLALPTKEKIENKSKPTRTRRRIGIKKIK
jgi:RNA-directed DNA polymerase